MTTAWMGTRSPEVGDAQGLSDEEILQRLNSLGLEMSRERLDGLTATAVAAEDLANELYAAKTANGRDLLWVWVLLEELWTRWFPRRMSREAMSELVDAGYEMDDPAEAVPYWLDLFDHFMRWLDLRGGGTVEDIEQLLGEDTSFLGWMQDIEERLHLASDGNVGLRARCIGFCEEYLRRFEGEDSEVTESMRRTVAELIEDTGDRPSGNGEEFEYEKDDEPILIAELLSEDDLLELLRKAGVEATREKLEEWTARFRSADELADAVLKHDPETGELERRRVVICLGELWKRLFPERPSFEMLDDRIQAGYDLDQADAAGGWMDVFDELMRCVDRDGMKSLAELDDRFPWTNFLWNWVQDVETSLLGACAKQPELFPRALAFCEEYLRRFGGEQDLPRENFRRTMAELIFESGDADKAEGLYGEWLTEDPEWGWGWIGRSDMYRFTRPAGRDLRRTERILREALGVPGVRDREDIVERLRDCLLDQGRIGEVKELEAAWQPKHAEPVYLPERQLPVRAAKVGRNDPCPCGSGKKYKKCCLGK